MEVKYYFVLLVHLLSTVLIFEIINFILPTVRLLTILICGSISTNILWICIAAISFQYTKKKFLNDKVEAEYRAVFITGCDSGFGHELAKRLDSKGFCVFASCLFPESKGASKLKEECSDRLHILPLDVRQNESVEKAVEYVKENLEGSVLWAVVNNAAILKGFSVEMSTLYDFKDVLDVNFLGTVRVTKAFLPLLKRSKGRIVNVTSLDGEVSLPFITPYISSKFATVGFTDCLRHEINMQGVSVVSVEPEIFLTPMMYPATINKNLDFKKLEGAGSSFDFYSDEDDYTGGYMKSLKDLINVSLSLACRDTSIVVDDLESAVSLVHPDHTYKPRRHGFARFICFCYEVMPRSFQILLNKIILFIFFSECKILKYLVMKIISKIIL